jgi:hypothetical protein
MLREVHLMFRIIAALLAGLLLCAQTPMLPGFPPGTFQNRAALDAAPAGGGFVGPGDAKALTAWWGVIAYSTATAGTKAILLCDSAGANCADVNTDAVTGVLSAPGTRGADNCSVVSTCKVKTVYDKVGTLDLTQTTAGNMPTLTPNALGTCYGITFAAGSSTQLASSGSPSTSAIPISSVFVAKNPTAGAQYGIVTLDPGGYTGIVIDWNVTPQIDTYNGASIQAAASANAWHAVQVISNTTSSVIRVDSSDNTGLSGGTQGIPAASTVRLGSENGTNFFSGLLMGAGYLAGTAFSLGERGNINTNLHAVCGGW